MGLCTYKRLHERAMNTIQKRAYASEAEENFRWIAFLLATRSNHILTSTHLADNAIHSRISDMGEYAEIAHGSISPSFVFRNLTELCRPGFPLESYKALKKDDARFVRQFTGSLAGVQGYVAFRPRVQQLVVAFSGTSSFSQTLRDMQSWRITYPLNSKRGTVHAGFWNMYQGVQRYALEALRAGFQEHGHAVKEIVLTGHSMGCTMCYLLALDLMTEADGITFLHGLKLNVTTFGSPRLGNAGLAEYWRGSVHNYRSRFGDDSFREYSVKGYNDGAHTMPPCSLGFRHLTSSPLYLYHGRLYHVPPPDCEHGAFTVDDLPSTDQRNNASADAKALSQTRSVAPEETDLTVVWPKGGHNYYFRDMEKLQREMRWLELGIQGEANWQERYVARLKAWEDKWGKEVG